MTMPRNLVSSCSAGSQVPRAASSSSDYAWNVNFNNGESNYNNQNNKAFVRAVRSSRASEYQGSQVSFHELYDAWQSARRKKVPSGNQLQFESNWMDGLFRLQKRINQRTWSPGPTTCFVAERPKAREIHAPDFSDRVVHHWLVPKLDALFEPRFIFDSYANRSGKGTHAAVRRLETFVRQVYSGQRGPRSMCDVHRYGDNDCREVESVMSDGAGGQWVFEQSALRNRSNERNDGTAGRLLRVPGGHREGLECYWKRRGKLCRRDYRSPERSIIPDHAGADHVTSRRAHPVPVEAATKVDVIANHGRISRGWYLQLDIRNFFNSIHRGILYRNIKRRLVETNASLIVQHSVHALLRESVERQGVVHRSTPAERARVPAHKRLENAAPGCGLPIGNLSSQFFANVYLDRLDQFVKHELRAKRYLRYVDDFVLVHRDRAQLEAWQLQIENFLRRELRLELKADIRLRPLSVGIDFLGYVVYPTHTRVRRRVVRHAFAAIAATAKPRTREQREHRRSVLASYVGHFAHADAFRLTENLQSAAVEAKR